MSRIDQLLIRFRTHVSQFKNVATDPKNSDSHFCGLAGEFHHRAPKIAVRIDLPATPGNEAHRQMDEALVPAGDHHAGLARHPGVDGVATQIQAENPVLGRGRHTADDIARVDVFEVELDVLLLEVTVDPVLEEIPQMLFN